MTILKFGELGNLFDGPHATPRRTDTGPYFLNIASLVDGRLDLSLSDHVSEAEFTEWTGGGLLRSSATSCSLMSTALLG